MTVNLTKPLLVSLALFGGASTVQAESIDLNGHTIEIQRNDMGESTLLLDGKEALKDGLIFLDEDQQFINGMTVLTGVSGGGGNACGASPIVILAEKDATPVVSGPVENNCIEMMMVVAPDNITFNGVPTPMKDGESWIWTPSAGFTAGPALPFDVDPTLTWANLDDLVNRHPADALKLEGVKDTLMAALGDDWPLFAERMSELGSGDMVEGGYLGTACLKYTCDEDDAVIFLDDATQKVSVIWHVAGEADDRHWPESVDELPEVMREELGARGL